MYPNVILIFITLLFNMSCQAQKNETKEILAQKLIIKNQRLQTVGGALIVTGGISLAAGISMYNSNDYEHSLYGIGLIIMGGSFVLGSVPLLLAPSKNKKRLASLSFGNQKVNLPVCVKNISGMQSSLTLTIKFGKLRFTKNN